MNDDRVVQWNMFSSPILYVRFVRNADLGQRYSHRFPNVNVQAPFSSRESSVNRGEKEEWKTH